jgi:hypothetical protein
MELNGFSTTAPPRWTRPATLLARVASPLAHWVLMNVITTPLTANPQTLAIPPNATCLPVGQQRAIKIRVRQFTASVSGNQSINSEIDCAQSPSYFRCEMSGAALTTGWIKPQT